jgi:ABC-2 type transport system permease protein
MLSKVTKYLSVAFISARSSTAYVSDVLGRAGFFLLILFILSRVWDKMMGGRLMEGFAQGDLVWYLVFTESLLLAVPRVESEIEDEVRSGSVAYLMVRPMHYLGFHLAGFSGEVVVRLGLNLLVGAPLAFLLAGPPPTPLAGLPWVLVAVALGLALHFHLVVCLALLAFWVEETKPFFWIYQKILFTAGGLMIPLEFFPDWLRRVLDALPFASVLYAPARMGVRFEPEVAARLLAAQAAWLLVFVLVAQAIYRRASRRLQVNGG